MSNSHRGKIDPKVDPKAARTEIGKELGDWFVTGAHQAQSDFVMICHCIVASLEHSALMTAADCLLHDSGFECHAETSIFP